jgi:hypothetical protein
MDVAGKYLLYHEQMICVNAADVRTEDGSNRRNGMTGKTARTAVSLYLHKEL